VSSVGSFFSYLNDARSHEPKTIKLVSTLFSSYLCTSLQSAMLGDGKC